MVVVVRLAELLHPLDHDLVLHGVHQPAGLLVQAEHVDGDVLHL